MTDNQGKQVPQPEGSPTAQMESNVPSAAEAEEGKTAESHEELVKALRLAVKAWQRSDKLHDLMHEIKAGTRQAPIMGMAIRGADGQPVTVEIDIASWPQPDIEQLATLFINNMSTAWLTQLSAMRVKLEQVDNLYAS